MSDTTSIIKTFNDIITKNISSEKPKSNRSVVLYKAGSNKIPVDLGKVSH